MNKPARHRTKKSLEKCVVEFGCAVTVAFHGKESWVARKGKESIYSVFVEVAPQVSGSRGVPSFKIGQQTRYQLKSLSRHSSNLARFFPSHFT
jgi:hypothetical protein